MGGTFSSGDDKGEGSPRDGEEEGDDDSEDDDPNSGFDMEQRSRPSRWGTLVGDILARMRGNDPEWTVARLSGKRLGVDGAVDIFDAMQTNTRVRVLEVASNGIRGASVLPVARCVYENEQVLELDLSGNPLGSHGIHALVEPVLHNNALTRLVLANVNIGNDECRDLADILHFNHSLTDLDLCQNHIAKAGAGHLGASLPYSFTLTRLALGYNQIGNEGLVALAKGMPSNRSLQVLDVGNNALDGGGLSEFLSALSETEPPLETLDLSENKLTDEGVQELGAELANSLPNLKALGLRNCDLTDEGVKQLCVNLHAARLENGGRLQLTSLDLSENAITANTIQDGVCRLLTGRRYVTLSATALTPRSAGQQSPQQTPRQTPRSERSTSSLTHLDLTLNPLGQAGGVALLEAVRACPGLVSLYYGGTNIPEDLDRQLHEHVLNHRKAANLPTLWEARRSRGR
eukprot:RCo035992